MDFPYSICTPVYFIGLEPVEYPDVPLLGFERLK